MHAAQAVVPAPPLPLALVLAAVLAAVLDDAADADDAVAPPEDEHAAICAAHGSAIVQRARRIAPARELRGEGMDVGPSYSPACAANRGSSDPTEHAFAEIEAPAGG